MFLLMLGALLTYRPGYAQATTEIPGTSSTNMVASARAKPMAVRNSTEATATKTINTNSKETVTSQKKENSVGRFWARIMGYCHEVHTAAKKKN